MPIKEESKKKCLNKRSEQELEVKEGPGVCACECRQDIMHSICLSGHAHKMTEIGKLKFTERDKETPLLAKKRRG